MTYNSTQNYRGVKASGAFLAILLTLGVNLGLFAMLGWMNHRAQSVPPAPAVDAHAVDLVKLDPEPLPVEPVKPVVTRSMSLKVKPVLPNLQRRVRPRLPMPLPLMLPGIQPPRDSLPLVDNLALPATQPETCAHEEQAGPAVHDENTVSEKPVRKRFVRPLYPLGARRMGLSGWVKVAFVVNVDGDVTDARVVESTGRGRFDKSAVHAVRRWQFKPGRQKGKPVAVRCEVTIEFNLEN